jgi:hypothetical protein
MFWHKKLSAIVGEESSKNDDIKAPNMIVGREFTYHNREGNTEKAMEFLLVANYVEFYKLIRESPEQHLYEVIYGNQKPHFDVDMELDRVLNEENENPLNFGDEYKQLLQTDRQSFICNVFLKIICQSIYDMFSKMYPVAFDAEKQFVITDSSTKDKISFHIVLDSIFHRSCQESKVFYDATVANIAMKDKNFDTKVIDSAVYKRNQQFRTLWSNKIGKSNAKKYYRGAPVEIIDKNGNVLKLGTKSFLKDYEGGDVCVELEVFARSLVSNTIACTGLRTARFEATPTMNGTKKNTQENPKLSDEISDKAWNLFKGTELSKTDGKLMFRMRQVNSNRILLQKLNGYHCPVCDRKHETENPYLTVTEYSAVFFNCRRAMDNKEKKASVLVGTIE